MARQGNQAVIAILDDEKAQKQQSGDRITLQHQSHRGLTMHFFFGKMATLRVEIYRVRSGDRETRSILLRWAGVRCDLCVDLVPFT